MESKRKFDLIPINFMLHRSILKIGSVLMFAAVKPLKGFI